jgi:hypothetical protein
VKAKDLLKKNETALAIFTDGRNLKINEGGNSVSGVWRLSNKLDVDKIIIYFRNKEKGVNEIYFGDFSTLLPSNEKGLEHRFAVKFSNTEFAGQTTENWNGFTNTKRGSVNPTKKIYSD